MPDQASSDQAYQPLHLVTQELFDQLAQASRSHARGRRNYNFHQLDEKVQRFLNVMQPGTYVRPHCHRQRLGIHRFEFFVVLQGRVGFLWLNELGKVLRTEVLSSTGPTFGLELAPGQYHTLVALDCNTVMLELKEGPYHAATDKDFLENFPLEGSDVAHQQVQQWAQLFNCPLMT